MDMGSVDAFVRKSMSSSSTKAGARHRLAPAPAYAPADLYAQVPSNSVPGKRRTRSSRLAPAGTLGTLHEDAGGVMVSLLSRARRDKTKQAQFESGATRKSRSRTRICQIIFFPTHLLMKATLQIRV